MLHNTHMHIKITLKIQRPLLIQFSSSKESWKQTNPNAACNQQYIYPYTYIHTYILSRCFSNWLLIVRFRIVFYIIYDLCYLSQSILFVYFPFPFSFWSCVLSFNANILFLGYYFFVNLSVLLLQFLHISSVFDKNFPFLNNGWFLLKFIPINMKTFLQ